MEAEGRLATLKRWLYRGGRPHRVAAILNRCLALVGSAGRPSRLPTGGHVFSPPVATASPRFELSIASAKRRP